MAQGPLRSLLIQHIAKRTFKSSTFCPLTHAKNTNDHGGERIAKRLMFFSEDIFII
jgi:hypothetical protein